MVDTLLLQCEREDVNVDTNTERPLVLHAEIAAKLNFACHQSAFAFLRDLSIENSSSADAVDNVVVTLSANPAFLKPKSWHVDRLGPAATISIKDRDIQLDGGLLLGLADSIRGEVSIVATKDDCILAEIVKPVELLAYNEWGGAGFMPELLAAFSMPNDPAVDYLLREASLILRRAGKPDGIDGYKSGSRERVWEITSAIYAAIANLGISYAVPPASFERDGQKIRLPSHVTEKKIATCLDTSMLFASALEQAGLNPIVAMPKGHAVAGVWLQPEGLATVVINDAETLRKRIQLNELVLIETTLLTSSPAPSFSKAIIAATKTIHADHDDTFHAAVDIRRARAHRIMPLGLKSELPNAPSGEAPDIHLKAPLETAPTLPRFDEGIEDEPTPETPAGRLERWQRKLLDLSARNSLLNHKSTKASLRLICPAPGALEDKLAEGVKISIQAVPRPTAQSQDQELHMRRTGEEITEEYARDALDRKQVLVDLAEEELAQRAVEIYRKAQTALQEGGSNTLYLAIGFLLWKRDEKDDRYFRAPLILLPVTLERKSIRSGIRMAAHDDEPRFNTTLLEMLRKDFHIDVRGLDGVLPADSSGIDVVGIWNAIRRAVKDAPGFEVIEDVVLGHFSFAKYLMWKDLVDRADALRANAIVKHLIDTPRDPYSSDVSFVDRTQIDQQFKPSDLFVPLPADSSQMAAIATADRGKDFIIIGPPGTGKSQTISNLIAHLLGKNQTVLFVSEKTAALEVVYRRLKEIGLGQFCLQLHSNKASKADVLDQLRSSWDTGRGGRSETWEHEAERLRVLRDQLNKVVDHLHMPRRNGMTAHRAIGIKVRDEALASRVTLSWSSSDYHDEARLTAMREAAEKLSVQLSAIGSISDSPFRSIAYADWSPQWEGQIVERAGRLSSAAQRLEQAFLAFIGVIGISISDRSFSLLDVIAQLAEILRASYRKQSAFALEADGVDQIETLEGAVDRLKSYANAQAELSCAYEPMAWRKLNGDDIKARWERATEAWWLKRYFAKRAIVKEMKSAGALGLPLPDKDAPILAKLRAEGEAIDRLNKKLSSFKAWSGHESNPDDVEAIHRLGSRARAVVGRLAADPQSLIETRAKIRGLLQDGNDLLAPDATVGLLIGKFLDCHKDFEVTCTAFEAVAGESIRRSFATSGNALDTVKETAERISSRHAELRNWCSWRRRRLEAIDVELEPLVEAIERGDVPIDEIEATFEAAYCTWWSSAIMSEDDVLRTFSTPEHVATIAKFRQADGQFQRLTSEYIAAKLTGKIPNANDVGRNSSWGVLRHELQKKARHKPVRQLIQEIPDVLTTLAPCLMMSPLSVAQYLPANQALFDVVIFDEASQITVWDAVGALARGRQAIVAGDPKQMPPTNFFARSDDDPDGEIDADGDLESILDEMLGSSIPVRLLNLHYRSRRESLIAFSNSRYYDNSLITFPAPTHPDKGVQLVRPEGFYARGKARHNEGEAKAIVAEIVRRIRHDDPNIRKMSIGVVTFNTEQQSLIENLLDVERTKNADIEWAFSTDSVLEPVFVKNLETVQGDERDVILFSVTYGPDQSGHVTMNFGPLNRTGGERRLNVAMTRARSEMLVYSTLHPERIDLSRTQATAVADLKHFLDYADRGPAAIASAVHGSIGDFESPFETAVARSLRQKGWNVHPQVGVSAYRIDLGIVHPDVPGIYIAGVECDGAMYHSSAFARERDKIRQSVLERLGWTLLRVWSTDWWTHSAGAIAQLHQSLEEKLENDRRRRKEAVSSASTSGSISSPQVVIGETPPTKDFEEEVEPTTSAEHYNTAQVGNLEPELVEAEIELEQAASESLHDIAPPDKEQSYVSAELQNGAFPADPAQFYTDEYVARLSAMIDHVIDTEGPIHEEILVRRIARHHGFQRAGRQIYEIVTELAKRRRGRTREDGALFFWRKGTVKDRLAPARFQNRDEDMRKPEYICKEEILAIKKVLQTNDALEVARRLGIARLSQSSRDRLDS